MGSELIAILLTLEKNPTLVPDERRRSEIGKSKWTAIKRLKLAFATVRFFLSPNTTTPKKCYRVKETLDI